MSSLYVCTPGERHKNGGAVEERKDYNNSSVLWEMFARGPYVSKTNHSPTDKRKLKRGRVSDDSLSCDVKLRACTTLCCLLCGREKEDCNSVLWDGSVQARKKMLRPGSEHTCIHL